MLTVHFTLCSRSALTVLLLQLACHRRRLVNRLAELSN